MTHAAPLPLLVLYLFAGAARRADLSDCLATLIREHNSCKEFDLSFQLFSEDVDLLRGGASHDLVSAERQQHYINRISSAVQILILAPPCDTHTRARHSFVAGPRPLRDASSPRGLPGLTPAEQLKVDTANILVDFTVRALQAAAKHNVLCLLEFPEDLGRTQKGNSSLHLEDSGLERA